MMTGTIRAGMSDSLGNGDASSLPGSKGQAGSGASVAQAGCRKGSEAKQHLPHTDYAARREM
jgi:hypothetical protein